MTEALRVSNIAKSYGPIVALSDISLSVRKGEALGLLGDNGAGKSTLIKIISGVLKPDQGEIAIDGKTVRFSTVNQARSLGVSTVFQDLALVGTLPVYRNLFLGKEIRTRTGLLDDRTMRKLSSQQLDEIGVRIPSLEVNVNQLSGGQRQAIAVARAVHSAAKVLLLDEPLAAMGAKEGAMILDLITRVKNRGDVGIILIAHNYAQVLDVCEEVNLLQDGRISFAKRSAETSVNELNEIVIEEYRRARAAAR